jgi:hypothetical protein
LLHLIPNRKEAVYKKMRPLAQKALEMIQKAGGRVINHDLLDATLREIGREYRPGLIGWIKRESGQWNKFKALEDEINAASLRGDEQGLEPMLDAYKRFIRDMTEAYESDGSLFTS